MSEDLMMSDLISRKAAINAMCDSCERSVPDNEYGECLKDECLGMDKIKELPPATQMLKDGTLVIKVQNADKVTRVLVEDTDSKIGGGLFYADQIRAEGHWMQYEEIADMLANMLDECACNVNGNDDWLPQACKYADTQCPHPKEKNGCWMQFLLQGGADMRGGKTK